MEDIDQELVSCGSNTLPYLKQKWKSHAGAWDAVGKFNLATGQLGPICKII